MLERLFNTHASNLQNALGRTTQRQAVLTTNLANVNVPGYKRRDLDFGITLQQELERGAKPGSPETRDQGSIRVDGNSVDLEREVFAIAETDMRYQMLTDMTARYFSGLKNAIKEGR